MATEEEYFVALVAERAVLTGLAESAVLKLPPGKRARLKALNLQIRELARRMGGSVRRKANAMLKEKGYPEVRR